MNKLAFHFIRILMPVFLLAIAFFPKWGAAYYIFNNFSDRPILFTILISLWFGFLALNLPLRDQQFRWMTTASILTISGALIAQLVSSGHFNLKSANDWGISAIFIVGLTLGWWTVSNPLRRWWRGVFSTDENEEIIEG